MIQAVSVTYAEVEQAREAADVGRLIDILDRAETPIRVAAARHLGELAAGTAVASLQRALRSPDLILRIASIKALGAIGDPSAAEAITEAAKQDELAVQATAAVALLRLQDPGAIDVLTRLALRDERTAHHSRRWAIRELAASGRTVDPALVARIANALPPLDRVRLRTEIGLLRRSG